MVINSVNFYTQTLSKKKNIQLPKKKNLFLPNTKYCSILTTCYDLLSSSWVLQCHSVASWFMNRVQKISFSFITNIPHLHTHTKPLSKANEHNFSLEQGSQTYGLRTIFFWPAENHFCDQYFP